MINFSRDYVYNFVKIHKRTIFKSIVGILVFSISFTVFAVKSVNNKENEIEIVNSQGVTDSKQVTNSNDEEKLSKELEHKEIVVYVAGEVVNPDVYKVKSNTRLNDLIDMAGGFTEKAYIKNLNLARIVCDEEKINIYSEEEINNNSSTNVSVNLDKNVNKEENLGINIKEDTLININTASSEQLQMLIGVGPKTAEKIIEYRKNKQFTKKEDILNVKGIGSKTYNKLKSQITTY